MVQITELKQMFCCESEKVKAALACMHVISEVTPWLWESQLCSHHPCVLGCVCQRDIPSGFRGSDNVHVGHWSPGSIMDFTSLFG